MKKWNYKKHQYEPYEGNEEAMLYSDDMEKECACAQCGKKMKFGDGYTSHEIQNDLGFGFCVCGDCMEQELKRLRCAKMIEEENNHEDT